MERRTFLIAGLSATTAFAAAPAFAGGHGRLGTFSGLSNHVTSGTAELNSDGVQLLDDFFFDGAPDPKVALGKDGKYDPATLMGLLTSNSGSSQYALPAGINAADYNEVWIWCEQFNVPLGVASVN